MAYITLAVWREGVVVYGAAAACSFRWVIIIFNINHHPAFSL
jgi:hypothetical protein